MIIFRIYLEPKKRQYFIINIHESKKALKKHCTWMSDIDSRTLGTCTGEHHYKCIKGKFKITPCIGQINIIKGYITAEIISHECFHAVMIWARRRKIPLVDIDDNEERVAYALGYMVATFANRIHKLNLWKVNNDY
jgi:hypothetical protein